MAARLSRQRNAPGLPSADDSISTTRVTLPDNLPPDLGRVDFRARTAWRQPHWPLVFMLVLTQLSVGALAVIWLLQLLGSSTRFEDGRAGFAGGRRPSLGASTLHLGRPIHA